MKNAIYFVLIIFNVFSPTVSASTNDNSQQYEESYFSIGYQSVKKALKAFENQFKQAPKLPYRVPPVTFTHQFGRFTNLDGNINDSLEVKY